MSSVFLVSRCSQTESGALSQFDFGPGNKCVSVSAGPGVEEGSVGVLQNILWALADKPGRILRLSYARR